MPLTEIRAQNFRCFDEISTELAPNSTLVVGPNASGKTSLLEAIYFLGRGRSFRVAQNQRLIKQGTTSFILTGKAQMGDQRPVQMGVQFKPKDTLIKVDGEKISGFAGLAENLPVQVIHPDIHHLVEGGPGYRRRFMDWGVFHVEQSFLKQWRDFSRALKQRNAGLKQNVTRQTLATWDEALIHTGQLVHEARDRYLQALRPFLRQTAETLLGVPMDMEYRPGWSRQTSFRQALTDTQARDFERKSTGVGPQRAEIVLTVKDQPAQGRISRGQQKLAAASLILAQLRHLESELPRKTLLLVDDPAAELDSQSLERFLGLVQDLSTQLVVTALRQEDLPTSWKPQQMFHVEQGNLKDVVQ